MTTVPGPMVVRSWTTDATETAIATLVKAAVAIPSRDAAGVNLVLCPPFTSLTAVRKAVDGTGIAVGAPAIRHKHGGEFNDEIAASILANQYEYVVVGNWRWSESMETVASETAAALRHGIRPILCVFDNDEHRRREEPIEETMRRQIQGALSHVNFELPPQSLAIAYEPAWTVESCQTLSAERASEILAIIRAAIAERLGKEVATSAPLLYAGRVKPSDADAFASAAGINGVLVIDDNVDPTDFMQIVRAFSRVSPRGGQHSSPSRTLRSEGVADDDRELTAEQQAISLLLKRSLRPVIDELENALQYLSEREAQGLQLVQDKLKEFYEWENISRVGGIGEQFDPDIHRAIGTDERSDYPSRTVVEVMRPGYRIEGQVVQKAEVIVNL